MGFLQRLIGRFSRQFSRDIAMDLGTANTLLYTKRDGIVVNEPSVVDIDVRTNEVLAIGTRAKSSRGRTPARIRNVRPLRDGVIADFDVTTKMIVHFIHKAIGVSHLFKPSMVISVPTCITQVEKKAVIDAAHTAGAGTVSLIEEPMASAIGAGLPIHEPQGSLVLDIGGGTSEVVVITMSAITVAQSLRLAGDAMNEAIQAALRKEYRLDVGENTAEQIKINIGSAVEVPGLRPMQVSGMDVALGRPSSMEVSPEFVRRTLNGTVEAIGMAVLRTLEATPPALAADIYDSGLLLAGGGSLLRGLDTYLARCTGLEVHMDTDPLTTVLRGAARAMQDRTAFRDVFIN